ncbi:MAG: GNAT family N-acetyltransferase [Allosphingosinicella sp.]
MIEALESIRGHYRGQGLDTLRYKAVPYIYHRVPASDDLYALFRLGARRYRCDLSSAIDLAERRAPSERRLRSLKKALKSGLEIARGAEFISGLWPVLEENLARKHGTDPVHDSAEIAQLHSLFPTEIEFVVALIDGQVEAGLVLFVTANVMHAQYIASSSTGYQVCALDALFESCLGRARELGIRYFDFGTSNEQEGQFLNEGLFQFKSEFGGGGVPHEFYELDLA